MIKVPGSDTEPEDVEIIDHRGYHVHLRRAGGEWTAYVIWPRERPATIAAGSREDAIAGAQELIDERLS
jgi:hypothetical protein